MKHLLLVAFIAALIPITGINAQQPSAILNLESIDKGFLPPRMTTAERDAIPNPTGGMIIYNTTDNKFQGYENGAWANLI